MYYIPKKNRCRCIDISGCGPCNIFTTFAVSSSLNTSIKASNTIFISHNNLDEEKGTGNLVKKGSGGNSYYDRIQKLKGNINCCK